jgi:adenosylcobinamide-phosphate synthase
MPALWCNGPIAILLGAAIVDFIIGDPWHWLHPVQVMGWMIHRYQQWVFRVLKFPIRPRWAGVVLGVGLPVGSGAIAAAGIWLAGQLSPWLAGILAVIILASCLAGRSLRNAAEDVLAPLEQRDISQAQERLSQYVGRDTQSLTAAEILRAVMETISENATDGVMAPGFYALVGLAIAPAAGVGLAIAYKALSTLDSMIGYRSPPYTHLGWFSARLEDGATWLPCRLTVLTIAVWSGQPGRVWRLCRRDAPADPSPNAGWSECAYAAALGVQLGGRNTYRGEVKDKPLLGDPQRPLTPAVIRQGLALTRWAFLSWLALGILGLSFRYRLNCG